MSPNKYPPPEQIPSAERQRRLYVEAVKEITHLRQQVANENVIAKEFKHDRDDLKATNKRIAFFDVPQRVSALAVDICSDSF